MAISGPVNSEVIPGDPLTPLLPGSRPLVRNRRRTTDTELWTFVKWVRFQLPKPFGY